MLGAMEEAGAEALTEFAPAVLGGFAAGMFALGAFALPLRQAILKRLLHRSELAPTAFRWEDLFAVLGLFLVVSAILIPVVGSYVVTGQWQPDDESLEQLRNVGFTGQAVQTACAFLVPCLYIGWVSRKLARGGETLGVKGLTPPRIPLGRSLTSLISYVFCTPFLFGAGLLTTALYNARGLEVPAQEVATAISEEIASAPLRVALFAVVVIPFLEEVLFRGFLLELFRGKLGTVAGVVISSALFGIAHGQAAAPTIFVLAVVIAMVKLRTRSLFAAWLIHALNNGVSMFLSSQGISP